MIYIVQAQAEACHVGVSLILEDGGPLKLVEDGGQLFACNADAFIAHADHHKVALLARCHADAYVVPRVFHGVVSQVDERLFQIFGIGPHTGHLQMQLGVHGFLHLGAILFEDVLQHRLQLHRRLGQHQPFVLQLGDGEHAVGECQQVACLFLHDAEVACLYLGLGVELAALQSPYAHDD